MSLFRIVNKKPIRWFYASLCRCGMRQTLLIIWSVIADMWFDFSYGTDTLRRIPRDQIETGSENKVYATGCGATKVVAFMGLMRRLKLSPTNVFVDLGSGKGRVVMLAAKYGFRKVIGIEFSGALCAKARNNLQIFLRKSPSPSQIEIIESDVTKYQLLDDETVFFMYDPFTPPVLTQVLGNIRASVEKTPRTVWLIYHVPKEQATVDQAGFFAQKQFHVVFGAEFRVYSNMSAAPV
jgi:SAM-dependent methyltransferase